MDSKTEARFWAKVSKSPNGCWTWNGGHNPEGYGSFHLGNSAYCAHRIAYELLVGPIPAGLVLDHLCRNPRCVNPGHLEPVTERENTKRGTSPSARNIDATHCIRGHEFNAENTLIWKNGERWCRECHRIRQYIRAHGGDDNPPRLKGPGSTVCPNGHPRIPANTFVVRTTGERRCLVCHREGKRRRRAAQRARATT